MQKKSHTIDAQLELFFLKEGDVYVAYCPSLNLATQGNTIEEANKAFDECMKIFLEEVLEANTLDKVLQECGWKKIASRWTPPVVVSQTSKRFAIPA